MRAFRSTTEAGTIVLLAEKSLLFWPRLGLIRLVWTESAVLLRKQDKQVQTPFEALGACTDIGRVTGPQGMRTVPANEPAVPVSGHFCEIITDKTVRATENQNGVGNVLEILNCWIPHEWLAIAMPKPICAVSELKSESSKLHRNAPEAC
jgi:hypothetical protein